MQLNHPAKMNPYLSAILSQFPLWDFVECNPIEVFDAANANVIASQFPLWDFVECNLENAAGIIFADEFTNSQFPLWDFVECN